MKHLAAAFEALYNKKPLMVAAPGRVNLIGEHTDYNQGFVLPGAVDKKNYVAIAENGTNKLNVSAIKYKGAFSFPINDLKPVNEWATYVAGVVFHIQQKGYELKGMDILVDGDVPVGAGMSSSAALCSAVGFAVNELFSLGISRLELAYIGQKTEHSFAGLKCGIMDQFASLHGKKGNVIKLDCRSMEYEYIPFDFPDYKIVLVNSMVTHSLAGSEYNVRRQQCEEGVAILQKYYDGIYSLRDISTDQLYLHQKELPPVVFDRCLFVVSENERLLKGCELLKKGDLKGFGALMFETHDGLSRKYEVSCPELDFLCNEARKLEEVAGSRMMGGGFGGCTINLIKESAIEQFTASVKNSYQQAFNKDPEVYITQIEDGAKIIS